MKKIKLLILILLIAECSSNNKTKTNFIKFVNEGKTIISSDYDVIKDKKFSLQIPNSLLVKKITSSSYFLHELRFKNNQILATLYVPNIIFKFKNNSTNCSYNEFKSNLKELDIEYALEDIKFIKNRRFGLKLLDDNFIIMYINVKKENSNDYEYSINSISLDKN